MKVSDMIQSPFLKRQDFPTPTVLTIKSLSLETVANNEEKWVLFFNEKAKGLVLNKTKIALIQAGYGDETDQWLGKKVRLSDDPTVMYAGQAVGGIKLEVSKGKSVKAAATPVVAAPAVEIDDDEDLPF